MALILATFFLIALIDLLPAIRRRSWRSVVVVLILFVPALTLAVLQSMHVKVPSIMILIGQGMKAIGLSY